MKKLSLAVLLLLSPALAQAFPWSQDMANQVSIKPQESFDPAHPGLTPFPKRSVPVPGTMTIVEDLSAAEELKNPVVADAKSIAKGGKLFEIYCVPCHGKSGKGDGYVGQKLVLTPYDLSADQTKERADGFIWGYITFGGAIMPPYGNDLNPTERWHVVNYIRNVVQKAEAAAAEAKK
ncbi:MAG: c-type cytochrome [Gallionellaceae bacterium]